MKNHQPHVGVSVIVPVYNEIGTVVTVLEHLWALLCQELWPGELIVVDDGSDDGTRERLQQVNLPIRLLRHETNRGYGAAIKTGIRRARYPYIAILDADGTYPQEMLPKLLTRLDAADMVVGARTGKEVHIPWLRQPAKRLLNWLANYLSNTTIPDLNSGMRVFRKAIAEGYFHILPDRFSFTSTITLAMLSDGYRVCYEPINYHKRRGNSKIRAYHAVDFAILILRTITYFKPLRIFVPIFFSLLGMGTVKLVIDVFWLRDITDSTILVLLSSLHVILIGVIADLVVKKNHEKPPV